MKQHFEIDIWLVERKKFNPGNWLNRQKLQKQVEKPAKIDTKSPGEIQHEVEVITRRIENSRLDLTCNYQDWLKLGFAFADEFGESGRSFFHRISKFNAEYDPAKCNEQFNKCLKRGKSGVTIKTFFAACKDAGINIHI